MAAFEWDWPIRLSGEKNMFGRVNIKKSSPSNLNRLKVLIFDSASSQTDPVSSRLKRLKEVKTGLLAFEWLNRFGGKAFS